jgi:PAS domain S-box-containing protein
MNLLDTRTVLFSSIITSAICALVMASLWRQNRRRSPEFSYWLANFVLQFLAILLIALHGVVIPDVMSVLFGAPLILTGELLLFIGLERYLGKTSAQRYNYILLALFILVHVYFAFGQPNLQARGINLSLGLLAICTQCAWLLLRRVDAHTRPETRAVGVIFAGCSLIIVLHIYANLVAPPNNDLVRSGLYDTLALLIYQILEIGLVFALILMVSHRLYAALENDIAERQRVEEKIRVSEQRYRGLFENMIEGYAYCQMIFEDREPVDWVYLTVNDAFAKLTGLRDVAGKRVSRAIPGIRETDPELFKICGRVAQTGQPEKFESYVKSLDMWFSLSVYCPAKGYFVAVFDVISERKRNEEALRQERERLAGILRGTNAGAWEWNVQTGETIFNERWAEIIGYTLDEISPVSIETWMTFAHPDDLKTSDELLQKHFSGELDYYECEARMRHKSGAWVWVLDRGRVTTWTDDGKPLMMMGTHQDITEHKRAEEELIKAKEKAEENEERYKQIFDNTFDIMAIYEVTEDNRYKVITFNPAEEKLIGSVELYQNKGSIQVSRRSS